MPTAVDSDGDTWSDAAEAVIGTNPSSACGLDSWSPDINNDGLVDIIGDITRVAGLFAQHC